jgi:16S rRNA (cytosine1402-N4)-methyltransferase
VTTSQDYGAKHHEPVLLGEVVSLLADAKRVLDCTLGDGGHSAALLAQGATVVGVDRDPHARARAADRLRAYIETGQMRIVAATFADAAASPEIGAEPFDGVLLDLGVSSAQIDEAHRGFTFRQGGLLDMRMDVRADTLTRDTSDTLSAAEWLNTAPEAELANAFREYADERRSRTLARIIAQRRNREPFATSDHLVNAIRAALGPRSGPPDFARLFQAVRIVINDEMGQLQRALPALRDRLASQGTLVAITYHSGEDRLVKRAFQDWSRGCTCPPRQPFCTCGGVARGITVTRKPLTPTDEEIARNPRARSAKLRAWRKRQQSPNQTTVASPGDRSSDSSPTSGV